MPANTYLPLPQPYQAYVETGYAKQLPENHAIILRENEQTDPELNDMLLGIINKGYRVMERGGSIRDLLAGTDIKDRDFITDMPMAELLEYQNVQSRSAKYPLCAITTSYGEYEVVCLQEDLAEHARKNVLTVCAMFHPYGTRYLIDFHHGFEHITGQPILLKTINGPEKDFSDNPAAILKYVLTWFPKYSNLNCQIETGIPEAIDHYAIIIACYSDRWKLFRELSTALSSGHAAAVITSLIAHPAVGRQLVADFKNNQHGLIALFKKFDQDIKTPAVTQYIQHCKQTNNPNKSIVVALCYALLLLPHFFASKNLPASERLAKAEDILDQQNLLTPLPRPLMERIIKIWAFQDAELNSLITGYSTDFDSFEKTWIAKLFVVINQLSPTSTNSNGSGKSEDDSSPTDAPYEDWQAEVATYSHKLSSKELAEIEQAYYAQIKQANKLAKQQRGRKSLPTEDSQAKPKADSIQPSLVAITSVNPPIPPVEVTREKPTPAPQPDLTYTRKKREKPQQIKPLATSQSAQFITQKLVPKRSFLDLKEMLKPAVFEDLDDPFFKGYSTFIRPIYPIASGFILAFSIIILDKIFDYEVTDPHVAFNCILAIMALMSFIDNTLHIKDKALAEKIISEQKATADSLKQNSSPHFFPKKPSRTLRATRKSETVAEKKSLPSTKTSPKVRNNNSESYLQGKEVGCSILYGWLTCAGLRMLLDYQCSGREMTMMCFAFMCAHFFYNVHNSSSVTKEVKPSSAGLQRQ